MANRIELDPLKASDWFRTKYAARGITIIFIYNEQQPF